MKNLSLYIHVPFCISKCSYCDFYSHSCGKIENHPKKTAYLNAVLRNIKSWKHFGEKRKVNSVFIGGGTPTVLSAEQLTEIISALKGSFDLSLDAEFTVESNPKTFDEEKLRALKQLGVNRLSIGVQSAVDEELRLLSRIHTFNEAKKSFELARSCGFDNINVDLMYGIPSQTVRSFEKTLDRVTALRPEHISVYGLQLEEGTPLWHRRDKFNFPSEDEENNLNALALQKLSNAGYFRYEISNYSLKSYECRHNLGYWSQGEYIGLGPGAYSYLGARRFYLPRDLELYCKCEDFDSFSVTEEILSKEDSDREFIMLSLRLTQGIALDELKKRTPRLEIFMSRAENFINAGFMEITKDRLHFTPNGFNISNYILSELLF